MSNDKKYYYIKLEDGYFGSKFQKALRKIGNGAMTIVYLKMQLKYAATNGYIRFDELYPTLEEEIAADIDESVEDVRMTMSFLKRYEFISQIEESEYILVEMQNRIGTVNDATLRKQRSREQRTKFLEKQTLSIESGDK